MRGPLLIGIAIGIASLGCGAGPTPAADDYRPRNTQRAGDAPPSPVEALYQMALPEGFEATLFAHEPAVRQPIAMAWDDRGRLWVVESYSYEEWEERGEDRILIFEDVDGDGRHDKRTLFWDTGKHFAGIALGFGGVWIADAPNVVFIPDRNGDDIPDGPPETVLTGWTTEAEHNMVNGLCWGPDGWLYGRHGVLVESRVGLPGAPEAERQDVSCGIWRYHPQSKAFERVAQGSTNPWGLDWDVNGEMFMSGNVNGHLWHVIPGSYLERMHPTTKTPMVYERLTMSADRPHYLGTANWKRDWNRGPLGRDGESTLGGGHSHCGAMIYQGDQWPDAYRGLLFMCNTHGRRVNIDRLDRRGSSFVGTYQGDFLKAKQSWFRGVTLCYGPDGAVYLSDWTDDGECHDQDGVHRTSGRIYRITHGREKSWRGDLGKAPDAVLVQYHRHPNAWFRRHSRRILHERSVAGTLAEETPHTLLSWLETAPDQRSRLEALWTLYGIGGIDANRLLEATHDQAASVRAWAVRLLVDRSTPATSALTRFTALASQDPEPLVRLHLAAAAQRIPLGERVSLLLALAARTEDHGDTVLQRVLWFALEPALARSPALAEPLFKHASPRIARLSARRLLEPDLEDTPSREQVAALLSQADPDDARVADLLEGALRTLQKQSPLQLPPSWNAVLARLLASGNARVRQQAIQLAVATRHAPTLQSLRDSVGNDAHTLERRLQSLVPLLAVVDLPEIDVLCETLLHTGPPKLRAAVLPSLPRRKIANWPAWLVNHWDSLSALCQPLAIEALTARRDGAKLLVQALAEGRVLRSEITATQAQRLVAMRDPEITALLETHWGSVLPSSQEKRDAIARYRALVTANRREPDRKQGREVYARTCAACHTLFEEGGTLGPDLTGSDRGNLDYLLHNIIDPSASVAADYRLTVAVTRDGRVISGSLVESDRSGFVIRTPSGEERLEKNAVENRQTLKISLMPEGIFESLTDAEVIDLIAFLQTRVSAP